MSKNPLAGPERIPNRRGLFYTSVSVIIFSCLYLCSGEAKDVLERSLKGIQLGTSVESFENSSKWKEVVGLEKTFFEIATIQIKNVRIFKMSSGRESFVCECALGKCFQIELIAPASETNAYVKEFTAKYGPPDEARKGSYIWEDNNVYLEIKKGPHMNIFLVDKILSEKVQESK